MIFVEDAGHYSVYRREDGEEVFVAHGALGAPLRFLVEFDQDQGWLDDQWREFRGGQWASRRMYAEEFKPWLRDRVTDPDMVDDLIEWCGYCETPTLSEKGEWTGRHNDEFACTSCVENYFSTCQDCDIQYPSDNMTYVYDGLVCQRCMDNSYSWCEECDEYYHRDYAADHDHASGGCMEEGCESPVMRFAVRFSEGELLWNDEQRTVTLPSGTIDRRGLDRIREQVAHDEQWYRAGYVLEQLGDQWQTRDGNYTRRLSRAAYNAYQVRLPSELLTQIGNIAREHSLAADMMVAVTRDLNLGPDEFGNSGSCWWESYSSSRCALKNNGGYGLRSFDEHGNVSGRVWVMPLKRDEHGRLVPTFNTETPDALVVFNGYGKLGQAAGPRVVAQMAGMAYRKISFTSSPMYINSEKGYLVMPEDQIASHTDYLSFELEAHADLFFREQRATEAAAEREEELVDA